jgi:hypothetical protein
MGTPFRWRGGRGRHSGHLSPGPPSFQRGRGPSPAETAPCRTRNARRLATRLLPKTDCVSNIRFFQRACSFCKKESNTIFVSYSNMGNESTISLTFSISFPLRVLHLFSLCPLKKPMLWLCYAVLCYAMPSSKNPSHVLLPWSSSSPNPFNRRS